MLYILFTNCLLVGHVHVGKGTQSYKDSIHGLKQVNLKSLTQNCYLLLLCRNCCRYNVQSFNCCVFLMLCNDNGGKQTDLQGHYL